MKTLGNIIWFIFGGIIAGLVWWLTGLLWCISIIGIPYALQCFKFSRLAFFPFGKEIVFGEKTSSLIFNIIWLCVSGLPMAVGYLITASFFFITIIGIPFGKQYLKLAKLALYPFGSSVV